MKKHLWFGLLAALGVMHSRRALAEGAPFGMEQAVSVALRQNRDVIAAKLEIRAAELDQVAAELYPNPILSYGVSNLVLGKGNPENVASGAPAHPGFFEQPVQNVGVSEIIDVWSKRGAHIRAAEKGVLLRRLLVEDALRDITQTVRSAFNEVLREQSERQLSRDMRDRYAETVRLSHARFSAGEISEAEFRKIELEGLKYQTDVVQAEAEYDCSRQRLASLLAFPSLSDLPEPLVAEEPPDAPLSVPVLTQKALEMRPDVRANAAAKAYAGSSLTAAKRDALPDIAVGVGYTHSAFLASGDNPNSLGLTVSLPLPIFDRNQANIGRAELDIRRAANDAERIELEVRLDVADTARRVERAKSLLAIFKGGGMLERADSLLRVAETSYKAGAILLELLEAQRTFLETRAQYLRTQHDYRQSRVDLVHAVGSGTP